MKINANIATASLSYDPSIGAAMPVLKICIWKFGAVCIWKFESLPSKNLYLTRKFEQPNPDGRFRNILKVDKRTKAYKQGSTVKPNPDGI